MNQTQNGSLLALDVGARRIGVALASAGAYFAKPLATLDHTNDIFTEISGLAKEHDVTVIVVGYPRGLEGQTTEQTKTIEAFVDELRTHVSVSVEWQDETLTSVKAETELASRHKGGVYNKADVDALAATYILEDYLTEHPGKHA
ncbi:MAG: Holliday junction resolvase RuvX [Candidatus Saccharimonadales bacterium]